MNRQKEILELKKLYILQIEKWERRSFFTLFSLSLSLIFLSFNKSIPHWLVWFGIALLVIITLIFEPMFQSWRTKKFNELKREIERGKFEDMKLRPDKR